MEEIIEEQKLLDIPPSNGKYTWSNKRTGKQNIKERLDKILIHENIAVAFTVVKSKIVHASASNHKPVVLTLGRLENQRPLPFINNKIWDSKEDFGKQIIESWKTNVTGSPHYVWETKLKNLRLHLKSWARENTLKEKANKIELQRKMDNISKEKKANKNVRKIMHKKKEIFLELYKQNWEEEEERR